MKKVIPVLFSLLLLTTPSILMAQQNGKLYQKKEKKEYKYKKEKTVTKNYPASGKTLGIVNKFGNINVTTTSGNEIRITVSIKTSSDNENNASMLLDKITVGEKSSGNSVQLTTKFGEAEKDKSNYCNNCNSSMEINYDVQLPSSVSLELDNNFGDIILPDYQGSVRLVEKFGELKAGKLQNPGKIVVEFGKATMVGANDLQAEFKFSTVTLSGLTGRASLEFSFCDASRVELSKDLSDVDIRESYSALNLRPVSGFSGVFYVRTSFGDFINRSDIQMERTNEPARRGADTHREFKGTAGNGRSRIEIKSSFGKIVLGEPTGNDMEGRAIRQKSKTIKTNSDGSRKVI